MWRTWLKNRLLEVGIVLCCLAFVVLCIGWAVPGVIALNGFERELVVESSEPIQRVTFDSWYFLDDATRQRVEKLAEPRFLSHFHEARPLGNNRYAASISYESFGGGLFRKGHSNYPRQLIVCVEFKNGSRLCRVLDLVKGEEREPLVIR